MPIILIRDLIHLSISFLVIIFIVISKTVVELRNLDNAKKLAY